MATRAERRASDKAREAAETRALVATLTRLQGEIAAKRDELRDAVEKYAAIIDNCEDADDALQSAIDTLSERL